MCHTKQEQASQLIKYQQNVSCHINDAWIRPRRKKFESQDPSAFLSILITVLYAEVARNTNIKGWPLVCYHKRGFHWCLWLHPSSSPEQRGSQASSAAPSGPQACHRVPYKLTRVQQPLSWTAHPSVSGSGEWWSFTHSVCTHSRQRHCVSKGTQQLLCWHPSTRGHAAGWNWYCAARAECWNISFRSCVSTC